ARGRRRLPDSVHAGADAGHPARRDLRDRQVGAQARVVHGPGYRRPVAQRQSGHPDRNCWLHRPHRLGRHQPPPVAGPSGRGARVPREQGGRAGPHGDEGGRRGETDRPEYHRRGARAKQARRTAHMTFRARRALRGRLPTAPAPGRPPPPTPPRITAPPPGSPCSTWVRRPRIPTTTASPTRRTPARTRPPERPWTRRVAPSIPTMTACTRGSTSAPARRRARTSTRRGAPPIAT